MTEFVILLFGPFILGLAFSYAGATTFESFFHDQILDISKERAALFYRLRKVAPGFWNIHVAHGVLHHHKTFKSSYARQFDEPGERARLITQLRRGFSDRTVEDFCKSKFGASFTPKGYIFYGFPIYAPPLVSAFFLPPISVAAIALASMIAASPFFIFSRWAHPFMHMRFAEMSDRAPRWIRIILSSDYGVAIRISHWVHHRHPRYNLNLQYGADLIRGRFRAPSATEYDAMVRDGVIEPRHRRRFEGRRFLLHPF